MWRLLLQQVIERGLHSGEGIQGCSIYTGTAGVAYMFLRLAESLQYTQQKMADHSDEVFAKLDAACLLNRAEEYGHWAKHLSHCGKHEKVQTSLALIETSRWNSRAAATLMSCMFHG